MKDQDSGDELSGIRATADERPYHTSNRDSGSAESDFRAPVRSQPGSQGNGTLWAVCGALIIALLGLGYWTHQQQTHLQRQLVATQNAFARVSEEAAGRLEDITGKVSATESSLSEVEQARRAIGELDRRLEELASLVTGQADTLQRIEQGGESMQAFGSAQQARLNSLGEETAALSGRVQAFETHAEQTAGQLMALQTQMVALQSQVAVIGTIEQRLSAQAEGLAEQRKALAALSSQAADDGVEEALNTLRRDVNQRLNNTEQELRAIDGFRLQTNRTLTTLQSQIRTLQQPADSR